MNRENKRKTFEKGYYKTHACNDTFTCKVCGGSVPRKTPEAITETIAPTVFQAFISISRRETGQAIAEE